MIWYLTHIAAFMAGIYFAVVAMRIRRIHRRTEAEFRAFERRVRMGIDPTYTVESKELTDKIELHEN